MYIETYLQVISISIALAAVGIPVIIGLVGFWYVRQIKDGMERLTNQVDELWDNINVIQESGSDDARP